MPTGRFDSYRDRIIFCLAVVGGKKNLGIFLKQGVFLGDLENLINL